MKNLSEIENNILFEQINKKFRQVMFFGQYLDTSDENIYTVYNCTCNNFLYYVYVGKINNKKYIFDACYFYKKDDKFELTSNFLVIENIKFDENKNILFDKSFIAGLEIEELKLINDSVSRLNYFISNKIFLNYYLNDKIIFSIVDYYHDYIKYF